MSRKKKHEHVNHERWLVSYADFITLLFAFFVVLFASGQSDKKKAAAMAGAMQTAFQQYGIFDAHAATPALAPGGGTSQGTPLPLVAPIETPAVSPVDNSASAVRDVVKKAEAAATAAGSGAVHIAVREDAAGTTLSLDDAGFFDSGSAIIRAGAMPLLKNIAASLPAAPIRVEGHTDNRPIHTAQFRSNWELSTARASAIAEVLMRESTVPPSQFGVAGYGEFHPIAGNATEAGRAQNRRVDIVLLRPAPLPVPSAATTSSHPAPLR